MKKNIPFLILVSILVIPTIAYAQVTILSIVNSVAYTAWIIATGVVVVLWLVTGMLFLLAQGAPEKLNMAKKALFTSVAGTVIVIVAFSALTLMANVIGV